MPYVKLDTGILDSTLWVDRDQRDLFITALLMAVPHEVQEPLEALAVREITPLGFTIPTGWYGIVRAAGAGIARRAGLADAELGLKALEALASPDPESRTPDFDGRRLVRIDGGFLVLNFQRYRDRDTSAVRSQRYREREKERKEAAKEAKHVTPSRCSKHAVTPPVSHGRHGVSVTQAVSSKQEAGSSTATATAADAAVTRAAAAKISEGSTEVLEHLTERFASPAAPAVADAYRYFRGTARSPQALDAQLRMMAEGLGGAGGRPVPWLVLGAALQEMQVAGATLTPATIRAFVKRLIDQPKEKGSTSDTSPLEHGSF